MSLLIIGVTILSGILLGKLIFRKWFNHLTLYVLIMGGLIFFYQLKLLPYVRIIPLAWFFIIGAFLSFLFGILTIVSARNIFREKRIKADTDNYISLPIFADGGKALKYSIIFFSLVGLFVAIHRWIILIHLFGSIPAVIINASMVYQLNVHRAFTQFLPILSSFVYVAIFLSGIYTAYKGRFLFLSFFPFIDIILKELTYFGRGEILLSLLEFLFSFFLFRHLLKEDISGKFKFSRKNAIIASTFLMIIILGSTSMIRVTRGNYENYLGASNKLNELKHNFIISPSIYLYMSSDVGVFSKYLQVDNEPTKFGENTFLIFYHFLGRLGIIKDPSDFQKGYYIPMWTNTGTYLRELHADFGVTGVFLGSYLIGFIITWLWFKFYEGKSLIVFAFLVYFFLIVGFSFLVMVTRLNQWYISLFLIVAHLPFLEKIAVRNRIVTS